jgi:hypothetical protein
VLSILSFPVALTSKETHSFFLSPSDGEYNALLALFSSSNLIAESFRVFSNPAKILPWILFLYLNSKSSSWMFWHLLKALLEEYQESSVILTSYELMAEFFLCALLAPAQFPIGRALQNSSEILSTTVFPHSLAS